jgi:2-dehydropantoate 2-reductase
MQRIESIAIIGAGALGLLYMDSISKQEGKHPFFLTDRDRYSLLKNKSFTINGLEKKFSVLAIDELNEFPDLILVCVKNHQLTAIGPLLKKSAGPDTIIISVLNGISSERFLEELLPDSAVLYCAVLGMDAVKENDFLTFTRQGKFLLGSKANESSDPLIKTARFLSECHLEYEIPDDIHRELWYKWMINIGVNQVSALCGAPYGSFQNDKTLQQLMENAMKETITVASAENVNLSENDLSRWYKVLHTLGGEGKTSMLQDIEAGRETEVESFSGELLKRAEKHGIKIPVNETLYALIKTRENLYL